MGYQKRRTSDPSYPEPGIWLAWLFFSQPRWRSGVKRSSTPPRGRENSISRPMKQGSMTKRKENPRRVTGANYWISDLAVIIFRGHEETPSHALWLNWLTANGSECSFRFQNEWEKSKRNKGFSCFQFSSHAKRLHAPTWSSDGGSVRELVLDWSKNKICWSPTHVGKKIIGQKEITLPYLVPISQVKKLDKFGA